MDLNSIMSMLKGKQEQQKINEQENPAEKYYPKEAAFESEPQSPETNPLSQLMGGGSSGGLTALLPLLAGMGGGGAKGANPLSSIFSSLTSSKNNDTKTEEKKDALSKIESYKKIDDTF